MGILFKKNSGKKGYLAVPEDMINAPFADIIACMDPRHLEDAVAYDFDKIMLHRSADDFRYLRQFPRWISLFGEKLDDIMFGLEQVKDFKKIITYFPEYIQDVYEFLIDSYINKDDYLDDVGDEIDIINDILIPMSDLEKYQNYHFSVIRKRSLEILDAADTYAEMWDILWAYETYFDMPRNHFEEYIQESFMDFVKGYNEYDLAVKNTPVIFHSEDYEILSDFMKDAEAYWYLMDSLPWLISQSGLDMYIMMIKTLGPVKEILDLHDYCVEFIGPDSNLENIFHMEE